jgi:hypothetical protein
LELKTAPTPPFTLPERRPICAAIVAAVRLARDQNIGVSLPRVLATITDSVSLARNIVRWVVGG